jgi:membrane-bound lytic murein transglycosylase B
MHSRKIVSAILLVAATLLAGAAQAAAPCRTSGPYEQWLADFEREAAAAGISQRAIAEASPYLTYAL